MISVNPYLSNYSLTHTNAFSLFIYPYAEAIKNFQSAFETQTDASRALPPKTLKDRCQQFFVALSFLIPLVNAVALAIIRKFCTTTVPAQPPKPLPPIKQRTTPSPITVKRSPQPRQKVSVTTPPALAPSEAPKNPVPASLNPPPSQPAQEPSVPISTTASLSPVVAQPDLPQAVLHEPVAVIEQPFVPPPPHQPVVAEEPPLVNPPLPQLVHDQDLSALPCCQHNTSIPTPITIPIPIQIPEQNPEQVVSLPIIQSSQEKADELRRQALIKFSTDVHLLHMQQNPGEIFHLSECRRDRCIRPEQRGEHIDKEVLARVGTITCERPVRYVSIGSGGALQDWALIARMIHEKSFKRFSIHLIDESYSPDYKGTWKYPYELIKREMEESLKFLGGSNTEIEVTLYKSVEEYQENCSKAPIDLLMAIDAPTEVIATEGSKLEPYLLAEANDSFSDLTSEVTSSRGLACFVIGGPMPKYTFYSFDDLAKRVSKTIMNIRNEMNIRELITEYRKRKEKFPTLSWIRFLTSC